MSSIRLYQIYNCHSAGFVLASVQSGWMMLAVLGVNHAFSLAQTGELGLTTVPIMRMWLFTVLVLVFLVPTAASVAPVSLVQYIQSRYYWYHCRTCVHKRPLLCQCCNCMVGS